MQSEDRAASDAVIEEAAGATGRWLRARKDGDVVLGLHVPPDAAPARGVTLFWPGRSDAGRIGAFFKATAPLVATGGSPVYRIVAIGEEETTLFEGPEPVVVPPDDPSAGAGFIRFERFSHPDGAPADPDYVVWAKLRQEPAGDDLGVFLRPDQLPAISAAVAEFIEATGARRFGREEILAVLRAAVRRLAA